MKFILGKKIGMTKVYTNKGKAEPATVIEAGPVYVTNISDNNEKTQIQIGFEETRKVNKPEKNHLIKHNIDKNLKYLRSFNIGKEESRELTLGKELDVSIFSTGDKVDVTGISKGKGFSGTVKRHNFNTGPKTHGSHNYRQPGSIGSAYPERVVKGRPMPGHMGSAQNTIKNLTVIDLIPKNNLLIIAGSVPGAKGSLVSIKGVK